MESDQENTVLGAVQSSLLHPNALQIAVCNAWGVILAQVNESLCYCAECLIMVQHSVEAEWHKSCNPVVLNMSLEVHLCQTSSAIYNTSWPSQKRRPAYWTNLATH